MSPVTDVTKTFYLHSPIHTARILAALVRLALCSVSVILKGRAILDGTNK